MSAVAVLGAWSWGTTLANLLAAKGEAVRLWAYEPEVVEAINRTQENPVFLPGVPLAESLRAAVAALEVPVDDGEAVRVTASFGIAVYPQTHNVDELMTAADLALYRAKRDGKNRVSVAAGESL